jgi:hypothetical protein
MSQAYDGSDVLERLVSGPEFESRDPGKPTRTSSVNANRIQATRHCGDLPFTEYHLM